MRSAARMGESDAPDRRSFLDTAATVAMAGGLLAGYGTFFGYAGRFLYPARAKRTAWMFLAETRRLQVGDSMPFKVPSGADIVVTRTGTGESGADFLALSSVCPHLGCQVHWEAANNRFFCPCHNGVFDASGKGTAGPPKGQSLLRYPLKVEDGLLYIEVPVEQVARRDGHDPCLGGGTTA